MSAAPANIGTQAAQVLVVQANVAFCGTTGAMMGMATIGGIHNVRAIAIRQPSLLLQLT
jgi:hypothetical protein